MIYCFRNKANEQILNTKLQSKMCLKSEIEYGLNLHFFEKKH